MQTRRQMLLSMVAAGLETTAPSPAQAQSAIGEAAKMNAMFDEIMAKLLRRAPELTTSLGLDKDDLAWTKGLLNDRSLDALAGNAAQNRAHLAALRRIDRMALTGMDAINYDTVAFDLAMQDEGSKFTHAGGGSGAPYVLSQLTGSYQEVPDFLDTQHGVETTADAHAYLQRMAGFARVMDQETLIAKRDYAEGVIPPDFVIDKALLQMKAFADTPTAEAPLINSIVRRTREKKIEGDWAREATQVYLNSVLPALERQIALLQSVRPKATHDAGVWRLKDGADYYAVSLKSATTSTLSPNEIHQLGLEMVAKIESQADKILRSQGMTQGTVGQRLRRLGTDATQVYENTDQAKEQLIADLNKKVQWIEQQLPAYFGQLPKARLEIRRVPTATEAGAPGGYYSAPSLDGKRPGIYWINLRETKEHPKFILPTLSVHEGVPGHHLQATLSNEAQSLPLIRKVTFFSGYTEGWALYAEELADEIGIYKDDPFGQIGMLRDALFRAARLVVDTGMHHKRWTREKAIQYMVDTLGDAGSSVSTEIERYAVWPGQACSYMVGKIVWLRAREKARNALGKRFDIRKFHDAGLLSGVTPLTVLESVIDDYIAATNASNKR